MDPLCDPLNNRVKKNVPPPPHKPLPSKLLFKNNQVNWKLLRDFLRRQGRVNAQDFTTLINMAINIFASQPNLIQIDDPITIVGDIHGQFYDFLKLLENQVGGNPETTKYLFLGDYVDRGIFSIEVLLLILALKVERPKQIIMLRGNHECRQLTSYFNFRQQCLTKYNQDIYNQIMTLFDHLPLACLVNGKFLCIHGGISHELKSLQDIKKIDRFRQVPKNGLFCDLVWADPVDNKTGQLQQLVRQNDARGCSYFFGYQLAKSFLNKNKLISIIRAHQAQNQGFKMHNWGHSQKLPIVITVFSAPNYCDYYNNKGAVIKFEKSTINIQQFIQSPHPYHLPNFLNLFSWSIPFVAQKVNEVLLVLIKPGQKFDEKGELPLQLMNKTKLFEAILKAEKELTKKQTEQNLKLVDMQGYCPDKQLIETVDIKLTSKSSFEEKRKIDLRNQSRPT